MLFLLVLIAYSSLSSGILWIGMLCRRSAVQEEPTTVMKKNRRTSSTSRMDEAAAPMPPPSPTAVSLPPPALSRPLPSHPPPQNSTTTTTTTTTSPLPAIHMEVGSYLIWISEKTEFVVGVSKTAALSRGRHLYSAGRPSRWALAHVLVCNGQFCTLLWNLAHFRKWVACAK